MNQHQYIKLSEKLGIKNCPVCGKQAIYCYDNKVNIFTSKSNIAPYNDVNIPVEDKYVNIECPRCGYIMTFNIEKLLE